jgi:hypothetical protein
MSMAAGSKIHFEAGSWLEAVYDVYIGTVVGAAHSCYIVGKWWYVHVLVPLATAFGVQLAADKEVVSKDGEKTLKVVAVGYGRTGTVRSLRDPRFSHCPPPRKLGRLGTIWYYLEGLNVILCQPDMKFRLHIEFYVVPSSRR